MGDAQKLTPDEQIAFARDAFENADDMTVAVEEEFQLLDPDTLELTGRFEELKEAVQGTNERLDAPPSAHVRLAAPVVDSERILRRSYAYDAGADPNGLLAVAAGVVILVWPGISLFALTILFGAWTLATGVVGFASALSGATTQERGWLAVSSLLGIGVGAAVLLCRISPSSRSSM